MAEKLKIKKGRKAWSLHHRLKLWFFCWKALGEIGRREGISREYFDMSHRWDPAVEISVEDHEGMELQRKLEQQDPRIQERLKRGGCVFCDCGNLVEIKADRGPSPSETCNKE